MAETAIIIEGKGVKSVFEINVQAANELFMGGADAGEVMVDKSPCVTFNLDGQAVAQCSLKFLADLDDGGDLGQVRELAAKHGMVAMENAAPSDVSRRFGNMPHYRTYTFIAGKGLYASLSSGMIFEHHRSEPDLSELTLVTKNQKIGKAIFNQLSLLPSHSKGRDVFAILQNYWDKKQALT